MREAALLSSRCVQVSVSMEKPSGTCFAGGGANGVGLRRSLWLEVGSVRQRRRAKTGPTTAPCTTITAALLSPRCMLITVSMEELPGTCFVPKGRFRGGLGKISSFSGIYPKYFSTKTSVLRDHAGVFFASRGIYVLITAPLEYIKTPKTNLNFDSQKSIFL